jgi:cysteinyl-tRNA synthetase
MLKENLTKWRQAETCYYELIHANSDQQENISEKRRFKNERFR